MSHHDHQWKAHCLLLSYPAQGHINPMLQFAKRLQHHRVKTTLVTTRFFWKSISNNIDSIPLESISDGYDEGPKEDAPKDPVAYVQTFSKVGSQTLSQLLQKLSHNGCGVDCVVYDSFLPWALDVAKKFGAFGAAFLTQSCAVNSVYYHLHQGVLKLPISEGEKILLPCVTELEPWDLPSFLYTQYGAHPHFWDLLVEPFSSIGKADWVLSNTVYELEPEVVDWMRKIFPLRTIGPTVPSMFLDKKIQDDDDYGINMFKPSTDLCIKWLNDKPKGSIVYASFGSLASLSEDQMEELAWSFIDSDSYFLWIVRESEEAKLPKNFMEMISEKGLVVRWCPQLQVLSHEAVGCFVTHCGWNSTLEAVSLGVPMIVVPQWSDQSTNAKHIVDVWKIGVRAALDEKGILKRETLENCIEEVMESEKGKEIKDNAIKWRDLTRNAIDEGGSSYQNIIEFVDKLSH
ncbi:UDP-glycosyltransferase 74F2-like [Senna tora]|uniref:Glycosyltransferase n=1 Tax=Senna tora TaxID=362788 RepID=A0A835CKU3_9FABA|nr:UDP-glycosyltransferase 74F2-like [Senna tora]